MANSPYVASRLQTYTEKGRQRLEFLLAKLGIPLREARGSFQCEHAPLEARHHGVVRYSCCAAPLAAPCVGRCSAA